jgi:hypothetical protein
MARGLKDDLPDGESIIFLLGGLDRGFEKLPDGQISSDVYLLRRTVSFRGLRSDLRQVGGYPNKGQYHCLRYSLQRAFDVRRCCRPRTQQAELQRFFNIIIERLQRLYDAII